MKMKINKFFAAALAATIALSSCVKEDGAGNGGVQGDETFAGISISVPMATGTRTEAGQEDANVATSAESAVSNIAVYVVGGGKVDKLYLTVSATDFVYNAGTGLATAKKAIRTTTGAKTIYVVANYTDALKTQIESMGAAAFGQNAIALDESYFKTESGGTLVNMTMTGSADKTLAVMSEADALLDANMVAIDVYRNLAKVVVRHNTATPAVPTGGKHETGSLAFGLTSKAKGAWLSNTPTTASGSATATAYTGVPAAAAADETHAYWNNFSDHVLGTTGTYKSVNAYNSAYTAYDGFYCHENVYKTKTAGGLELYAENTTATRIRGKFIPNTMITAYNVTTGVRTSTDNSTSTTAVSFYRHSDGSYWNETAYNAATNTANSSELGYIPASSFTSKYNGGMGYYSINVMDQDRVPGVKRNNYYDLAIEAIEGPGSPSEYPEDGPTPIDEESYVSVKVTVKSWWRQSSGHTIQ